MRYISCLALSAVAGISIPSGVQAQEVQPSQAVKVTIQDGPLSTAIVELARQTGVSIGIAGKLPAISVRGFSGRYHPAEALRHILRGTGYVARPVGRRSYRIEREIPVAKRRSVRPVPPQEPELVQEALSPEIVVTATKREMDVFSLPYSIATLAPDGLEGSVGHINTAAVVGFSNGISSTNQGPGRNRLFIRGIADSPFNGPSQSTVGLFINDARINFDTPDPHLSLVDIERVEVLKGPQGPLYGTGVLGGIYRIVPRSPSPESTSLRVATGAGATQDGAISHASDMIANVPLHQALALRAVAYHEQVGGWIDDEGRHKANVNSVDTTGGRLALQWTPPDWKVSASVVGQRLHSADSQYATASAGVYSRRTNNAEPHDAGFTTFQLSVHHDLGEMDLGLNASRVRHDFSNQFDATAASPSLDGTPIKIYQEDREHQLTSQEARLSKSHGRFQWLVGVNHLVIQSAMDWGAGSNGEDLDSVEVYDKRHREIALFVDGNFEWLPDLWTSAGARLHYSRTDEFESFGDRVRHNHVTALTPSLSLSWQPDDRTMTWLRYSSAIRPGGLNPSATETPFTYSSDRLHSLELGSRLRRFDRRLSIEGNLFALVWKNIQSDILLPSGFIGTANFGRAHNFGAEVLANWTSNAVSAEVGGTVQHGDIYSEQSVLGRIDDTSLPSIPRLKGHARISLPVQLGQNWPIRLGGAVEYGGSTRLSFDPTLNRVTDDHTALQAFVQGTRGPFRWTLSGSNLLNSKADTFGFGNQFSIREEPQRTPLRPRSVMLRLEWEFSN